MGQHNRTWNLQCEAAHRRSSRFSSSRFSSLCFFFLCLLFWHEGLANDCTQPAKTDNFVHGLKCGSPAPGAVINAAVIGNDERNLQFAPRRAGALVMALLSYEKWKEAISSAVGASMKDELDKWRKESGKK